jgi:hypothetical protein
MARTARVLKAGGGVAVPDMAKGRMGVREADTVDGDLAIPAMALVARGELVTPAMALVARGELVTPAMALVAWVHEQGTAPPTAPVCPTRRTMCGVVGGLGDGDGAAACPAQAMGRVGWSCSPASQHEYQTGRHRSQVANFVAPPRGMFSETRWALDLHGSLNAKYEKKNKYSTRTTMYISPDSQLRQGR